MASSKVCSRCGSVLNTLTITSSFPPWCPVCGADFKEAPAEVPARVPVAVAAVPAADVVPLTVTAVRRVARRPEAPRPRVSGPTVPLPAHVPAEIAARGDPEAVYATDPEQFRRSRRLIRVTFALLALLALAVAGFHFYHRAQPVPGYDLRADTALGIGVGTTALGVVLAAAGLFFTSAGFCLEWWGPRTYLLYEDVLVDLRAGRHRVIPWESLGDGAVNALVDTYRFPVRGGRAVTFDATVTGHEKLAEACKERAAARRYRLAFGDPVGLDEMRTAAVGPSVLARGPADGSAFYRVTRLGDRLLFLRGVPAPVQADRPPPPIVTAGLVGGVISAFNSYAYHLAREKAEKTNRRLERADAAELLDLAHELDGSFVAGPDDVEEIRLDPLARLATQPVCALKIRHARLGEVDLVLWDRDSVLTVVRDWAEVFGDVIQVNVAWSHSRCRFIRAE